MKLFVFLLFSIFTITFAAPPINGPVTQPSSVRLSNGASYSTYTSSGTARALDVYDINNSFLNSLLEAINLSVTTNTQATVSGQTLLQGTASATAASVTSIDNKLSGPITVSGSLNRLWSLNSATDSVATVVSSSALPTGAATSANQTLLQSTASATASSLVSIDNKLTSPLNVTAVVSSSALPAGAATSANQTNGSQLTQIVQGGNTLSIGSAGNLTISGLSPTGSVPALNPVSIAGTDAGNLKRSIRTDTVGRVEVNAVQSVPQLPTALSNGRLKVESTLPNDYSRGVFGAQRVVTTQNVFESLFSFDKQPLIWDEVLAVSATATFNSNTNSIDMTTTTASGSSVVRQTFRRIRYNPSRAVQLITAGTMGAGKTNVRKRIGQFDAQDGLYFEQDGTTLYVVRRSSTSGSVVENRTPQSSWNIDRFDGSNGPFNPSGITLDLSKHQAFFIQYAFQGFADITYGFYLNGQIVYAHKESTANFLTAPFMKTGHLPARIEITNTGVTSSPTTFAYNSYTIKNEGEDAENEGATRSYSSGPLKAIGTTVVPIISVRLGAGFEKAVADIVATNIFVNTVDEVIWSVWINPTLTGSTFAITASYTQLDTAATAMTGGTELISGILTQQTSSNQISLDLLKSINTLLGVSINGTPQIITLAARSRVGSADVLHSIVWKEYP